MYRTPATTARRFSIEETTRRAATSALIVACGLLALSVAVAGWHVIDHYGHLRAFLAEGRGPSSEALRTLVFLGLIPLAAGRVALTWWRLRRNHAPAVRERLARFGDPDAVAAAVAAELDVETEIARVGPLIVSPSWIVWDHADGLELAPLRDVVWAYARTTRIRVNGVPVARTRGLEIHTRAETLGSSISIPMDERDAAAALALLAVRAPWMLLGHDQARADRWYGDRASIVAECDRRREEHLRAKGAATQSIGPSPPLSADPPR